MRIEQPYTIVEIGAGRNEPVPASISYRPWEATIVNRRLEANQRYIGLDIGAVSINANPEMEPVSPADIAQLDSALRTYWRSIQRNRPEEAISFMQADARWVPLRAAVADEVIVNNLFSRGAPLSTLVGLYLESMRLLKPEGKLIIHDDFTPQAYTIEDWRRWLERYDLPASPDIRRLNAGEHPKAYREYVALHGLVSNMYTLNRAYTEGLIASGKMETSAREHFNDRTVLILGKAATLPAMTPLGLPRGGSLFDRLRRLFRT